MDENRIQSAGLLIEMTRCHLDQQSRALDAGGVHKVNDNTIGLDLTVSTTVCTVEGAFPIEPPRPSKMARSWNIKDAKDSYEDDTDNTIAAASAAAATAAMSSASSSAAIAWIDM